MSRGDLLWLAVGSIVWRMTHSRWLAAIQTMKTSIWSYIFLPLSHQWWTSLVQIITWCQVGAKSFSIQMLTYGLLYVQSVICCSCFRVLDIVDINIALSSSNVCIFSMSIGYQNIYQSFFMVIMITYGVNLCYKAFFILQLDLLLQLTLTAGYIKNALSQMILYSWYPPVSAGTSVLSWGVG